MTPVTNPVVVITGASSGIGRATAHAFARKGARLVLAAREIDPLRDTAAECEPQAREVMVASTDVTDPDAVRALANEALQRFGRIDVWINNVGTGAVGRFEEVPVESHRRVIEANLLGHLYGAHAVLPHFLARRRGILINMISIGGYAPSPYAASYAASKFGLRGFSESLRAELARMPDVHVCDVYPTFVDSPGMSHGANYTGKQLRPPPGTLDPEVVAAKIVGLMRSPRPSTLIGAVAWPARIAHAAAPELTARSTRWIMDRALERADAAPDSEGNLFASSGHYAVTGGYRQSDRPARKSASAVPLTAGAVLLGVGILALGAIMQRRGE